MSGGSRLVGAVFALWATGATSGYAANIEAAVAADVATEGTARVIVALAPAPARTSEAEVSAVQSRVLAALEGSRHVVHARYDSIPYVALAVSAEALARLADHPDVVSVGRDNAYPPLLAESVPLIGAAGLHAGGFTGAPFTVAVMDTGVESSHPFFTGRVLEEACFASGDTNPLGDCPNGTSVDFGPGSGAPCTFEPGCDHGTHVAGIAAGASGPGSAPKGVAPAANIVALQVFSRFDGEANCGDQGPCALAFTSDQLLGLEHVRNLAASRSIAAVNVSIGGGAPGGPCDSSDTTTEAGAYTQLVRELRIRGVATVIASGNNGSQIGVTFPACLTDAITVGSSTKSDNLSGFSNNGSVVDVLAPGSAIISSEIGGTFGAKSGTSMAAPHVAGAWAMLRTIEPTAGVDKLEWALERTGLLIEGEFNTKPRIRTALAAAELVHDIDSVGLYESAPGQFLLKNRHDGGNADATFGYGPGGGVVPVIGNWDGDPFDSVGVYDPATGTFFLSNENAAGPAATAFTFGASGLVPIAGDWNGDGFDSVGVYDAANGNFFLTNSNAGGPANHVFSFGSGGHVPLAGDWNGDGSDSVGVYDPATGMFFLRNALTAGPADETFSFGPAGGARAIVGDWDFDGTTDVGVFTSPDALFFLRTAFDAGPAQFTFQFGAPGTTAVPISGDWNGE